MVDEASKEVLAFQVSYHPNLQLVKSTIDELLQKLPDNAHPIIHSDQGWQYQQVYYAKTLANLHFVQSMSRKGNCHDNAPIESFFHLYKTELFNGFTPCKDFGEFKKLSLNYVYRFNNQRISLKQTKLSSGNIRTTVLMFSLLFC